MSGTHRPFGTTWAALGAALTAAALLSACGSGGGGGGSGDGGGGTTISMWSRSANADLEKAFVAAYNSSHQNKVELTIIPNDNYQTKVGTAAGSRSLPDVLSSDVVYMPNYTTKNLFLDITAKVDALSYKAALAPSHLNQATLDGKVYGVPHTVDGSALFYNTALFTKAGLDPAKPPTTYAEFVAAAKKISALGNGVSGFYFGGNCAGCNAYDMPPSIWGSGGGILNQDGTQATFDTDQVKALLQTYHQMWADGSTARSSRNETGATLVNLFQSGKVGMVPLGSGFTGSLDKVKGLKYAVAPMPTQDGASPSTFVGGDVIGISSTTKKADAAWDFIKYTLEQPAQVDIMAKAGYLPARTDLADNPVTAASPQSVVVAKLIGQGRTPRALNYGAAFNDANGPWLTMIRKAVFDGDVQGAVTAGQSATSKILSTG